MRVLESPVELQQLAWGWRSAGRAVALVPTMGCLHDGHLSLVRLARREADIVVLSLFVNPIQFGPHEDYGRYPRPFERDLELCEDERVNVVFAPRAESLYAADHSVYLVEERITAGLCGAARPGHFRGVLTVVAKLLNLVAPQVAVFGQKDAQQVRVIQQLVRDLNFPVRIVVGPIIREHDGVAMSSRNRYLSPAERQDARALYRGLESARLAWEGGVRRTEVLRRAVEVELLDVPSLDLEYIEVVDYETFKPVDSARGRVLVALAARVGATRLIDNVVLGGDPEHR